jgi:hypothetical protein
MRGRSPSSAAFASMCAVWSANSYVLRAASSSTASAMRARYRPVAAATLLRRDAAAERDVTPDTEDAREDTAELGGCAGARAALAGGNFWCRSERGPNVGEGSEKVTALLPSPLSMFSSCLVSPLGSRHRRGPPLLACVSPPR